MKQLILAAALVFTIANHGCKKDLCIPSCIQSKIDIEKNNPSWPVSQVDEYTFQGKPVYLFNDGSWIADGGTTVYDANCNQLCFLGGIGGLTTCNGVKFADSATFKRTIWKR